MPEGEALFEMANLSPKRTGLPFVVWISPKAGAPHDIRVEVSRDGNPILPHSFQWQFGPMFMSLAAENERT